MTGETAMLQEIQRAEIELTDRYKTKLVVNTELDRKIVSFQANKVETGNRWFKYKEGFSATLMRYIFAKTGLLTGHLFDPFAGAGTALFAAAAMGMEATGIELLPSSAESIEARRLLLAVDHTYMAKALGEFRNSRIWETDGLVQTFSHIKITSGAFPDASEQQLCRYLYEANIHPDVNVGRVLRFAAMCILEAISFTRKDGQYLRWDWRSERRQGAKPFDKGCILGFTEAITSKLCEIESDLCSSSSLLHLFDFGEAEQALAGEIHLLTGSCLEILPTLKADFFDGIITSPPYANRYDYTRTYALELAMMGTGEEGIRRLRQAMLSCTVENKAKEHLSSQYPSELYDEAMQVFERQEVLQQLLTYLEDCKANATLNNSGIPRMIRGYFFEMALVIFQCARVLKSGAPFVMVNDNVRYMGAHVPVDLILSDFAAAAGLHVETIWVLPRGKGNSSQQMGAHGREEVRKCVYVWRRL
jgi:DNA modification methylase